MLLCVSASHKTAPFELLERLSVHTDALAPAIISQDQRVRGAVVVATCNRVESYLEIAENHSAEGIDAALRAIEAETGISRDELNGSYRVVADWAVAEHLFAVASGLESVIVGEGEIAGQVRRALQNAREHQTVSPELERLFQRASEAQRGVKNKTALSRAGRSMVRLALELADSRVSDWATAPVLLVGTGSYAAATVAALRDAGARDIAVHSPSGRAEVFAHKHSLRAIAPETFASETAKAQLLISCTSAEMPVVDKALLQAGREHGTAPALRIVGETASCPVAHHSSQLIIDLGLPRNVDPDVSQLRGVEVLDLETIRLHAPLEELQASEAAREIVRDAARRFAVAGQSRTVTPAVVALREHVNNVLETEIARARAHGDDGTTEHALRHFAGVLLHTPTTRAHQLAAAGRADAFTAALQTLFGVEAEASETGEAEASGVA